MNTKYRLGFLAAILLGYAATAGAIKTWNTGEYITASDLNTVLAHLHANVGHGHGPILINSDISSTAKIAHSKLATPALLPKVWVSVAPTCYANPCTISEGSGVSSVSYIGTAVAADGGTDGGAIGQYEVNYTQSRANSTYGTYLTSFYVGADVQCHTIAQTVAKSTVYCTQASNGAYINSGFNFMLMDVEN